MHILCAHLELQRMSVQNNCEFCPSTPKLTLREMLWKTHLSHDGQRSDDADIFSILEPMMVASRCARQVNAERADETSIFDNWQDVWVNMRLRSHTLPRTRRSLQKAWPFTAHHIMPSMADAVCTPNECTPRIEAFWTPGAGLGARVVGRTHSPGVSRG